jgi:hypothetical protein
MSRQFQKHYTVEEARQLLPHVTKWLERLSKLRAQIARCETLLQGLLSPGSDLGGELVNEWVRGLVSFQETLLEFYSREIQLKDLDRGLVDFPAIIGDREVFLCWEKGEPDIEFWHDLDTGYAGREPI